MLLSMETKREFNKTPCTKKASHAESLRFSKKLIIFFFFLKENEKEKEKEKEHINLALKKQRKRERFSDLMKSMPCMENPNT